MKYLGRVWGFWLLSFCLFAAGLQSFYAQVFLVLAIILGLTKIILGRLLFPHLLHKSLINFFYLSSFLCLVYMFLVSLSPVEDASMVEVYSIAAKFMFGPLVFVLVASSDWENDFPKRRLLKFTIFVNVVLIIAKFYYGVGTGNVLGGIHSNYMGLFSAFSIALVLIYSKAGCKGGRYLGRVSIAIAVIALISSFSRGAAVALLGGGVVYFVFGWVVKKRQVGNVLLVGLVATLISVSSGFDSWVETESAKSISAVVEDYTGKKLDTGRAKFWASAMSDISGSPVHGIGVNARRSWERELSDGRVITLSVHNYFLAVMLEAGAAGLFVIIILLLGLINVFAHGGPLSFRLAFAIFVGILLHQTTQVSLTTGTFTAGFLMWFLLGVCFRLGKYANAEHYYEKV